MIVKAGAIVVSVTFAASVMEKVAGTLGLVAASVVASGIILGAAVKLWRFARGLEKVVTNTSALPDFMREQAETNRQQAEANQKVHERLEAGDRWMGRVEGILETWGTAERVGMSALVEMSKTPPEQRPARRTDPAPRTGWRE